MNSKSLNIKKFVLIFLLAVGLNSYSQKTKYTYVGFRTELFIHYPQKEDQILFDTAAYLINNEPTASNYRTYYLLAAALWELKNISDSKKMFMKIINSTEPYYENTYYYSSDIPGDSTINIYGYGSYTSNYKNKACDYLAKIYIEQKKYDSAYQYLDYAVNKYKVSYSCGTGHLLQQSSYRYLYGLCYEGLEKDNELFDLLLPYCFDWENETIIRVIKNKYTKPEIRKYLRDAIQSVDCIVDKKQSSAFIISNYGEKNEKTTEIKYYGGIGTINLFGRKIALPTPSLENREILTRQYFVNLFKKSNFYRSLYYNE
jgi:hypothetical protein